LRWVPGLFRPLALDNPDSVPDLFQGCGGRSRAGLFDIVKPWIATGRAPADGHPHVYRSGCEKILDAVDAVVSPWTPGASHSPTRPREAQ
jgi:hypothetical protein